MCSTEILPRPSPSATRSQRGGWEKAIAVNASEPPSIADGDPFRTRATIPSESGWLATDRFPAAFDTSAVTTADAKRAGSPDELAPEHKDALAIADLRELLFYLVLHVHVLRCLRTLLGMNG